jgi:hypothetical protein
VCVCMCVCACVCVSEFVNVRLDKTLRACAVER